MPACGGDDDGGAAPTAETFETVDVTDPLFTRTSDDSGDDGDDGDTTSTSVDDANDSATDAPSIDTEVAVTEAPDAEADPATTLATVPDTGVPGIESADVFCRSWSEFAGSFQALAGAWALGDPGEAARLEVAASATLLAAVDQLLSNVPAEVEPQRDALTDLVDPMSRRAASAHDEMTAAGLDGDSIDALGAAWLAALAAAGVDQPDLTIVVPADVDEAAFTQAVEAFAAARPSIIEDPSLITDAVVPDYLIENCPDQGTLAGNDVIEG
jgi:hypothetical protein